MQERELRVGIGDMKFTRGTGKIITYALGSCIGISFWVPFLHLGALLHIMLPERHDAEEGNIYKYADSGIHETIRKLSAFGMVKSRTVVKIAGGAKMFEIRGNAEFGNIGSRNTFMVKKILQEENMRISAEDTGGAFARTMILDIESGDVAIRTMGKPERHL